MEWTSEQCNNKRTSRRIATVAGFCAIGTLVFAAGCHLMPDPYHDEFATAAPVATPSATGIREAGASRRTILPIGEEKTVRAKCGTVIHGPLYFEDPTNESGSDDGQFAITQEDFYAFWSTPFRFELNAVLFPISFLVTPPCMPIASDGIPSRKVCCGMHDATPLPAPTG